MSASLVGSEMCIRDRDNATWRLNPATHMDRSLSKSAARARRGPSTSGPVSYTHLTLPTICSV
eukprot:4201319-Alexandrium_andersonii.AAC.1